MNLLRTLRFRWRALLGRDRLDREMDEEMRFHLEMEAREHAANGLPLTEARRRAAVAFGGRERIREEVREARGWLWLESLVRDVRQSWRSLRRSPAFLFTAITIVALGIGGNTVVFSLINGIFIRPLPFPHPEQLVDIDETAPKWNLRYVGIHYRDFEAWREQNETFTGMAHWRGDEFSLATADRRERVPGQRVTHDLADVLGIQPVLGRMFRADEELRGGPGIALIGYHIWEEWFGCDPDIVGRMITIDAQPCEIIGVLPRTAVFPSRAGLWLPFASTPTYWAGLAIGRLKPGVTIDQASADLLRIHRSRISIAKENEITSPCLQPVLQRHLGDAKVVAVVLQGFVSVLFLIACANVAGLMLARSLSRTPEIGMRAALGASRFQIARQLTIESTSVALLGAVLGVFLGHWLLHGWLAWWVTDLPAWAEFAPDWRFALVTAVLVMMCGSIAGLVPARHLLGRRDYALRPGPDANYATFSGARVASLRLLVVGEIAMAVVLLIAAGLLGRAFLRVQRIDPGFQPDHLLAYGVVLPEARYKDGPSQLAFFREHLERVRALPGVESASASTVLPFSGGHSGSFFEPEGGMPGGPDAQKPVILTRLSLPGYLETMRIPLVAGHDFGEQDWQYKIIVNETLAQLFWPGSDAIGKRMRSPGGNGPWLEVVGVTRDVRHYGLETEMRPGVYVPFTAMPRSGIGIVIRTQGDPEALAPAIRDLIRHQDPTLPIAGLASMEDMIARSLAIRRMYSGMTLAFAAIALTMATAGLYGIIAYVVGRRAREFGIRTALGATARNIARLVVRDGLVLVSIGLSVGMVGGLLAAPGIAMLLAGVSPFDPVVLAGATVLVTILALAACLIPARRATRVDPIAMLRTD